MITLRCVRSEVFGKGLREGVQEPALSGYTPGWSKSVWQYTRVELFRWGYSVWLYTRVGLVRPATPHPTLGRWGEIYRNEVPVEAQPEHRWKRHKIR